MESKHINDGDRSSAKQMRTTNYEQFKSLVRMHLSFELDLNTDEFDLPCHEIIYYERGKVKKWNRLSKKIKGCTSGAKTNSPPEAQFITLTGEMIKQSRVLKDFLMQKENIVQEGIFRRTGAISRQNEIRQQINLNKKLDLTEGFTVHDCATVYKGCLADLVEPLLTDAHYPAHCQIADLCNADGKSTNKVKQDHLLHSIQLLMLLLPEANRVLFEDIIDMLHATMKYESSNKMSADSLATLFAPHLICPRNLPAEALHYVSQNMSSVISYMIVKGNVIFDIPPKLATDIRAYSLEQKRKKTMSPEQILDESTSDISTVNTVYTFIDREKTAEAHNSNPTDTALAQLYAHIQSLPESSKKRKLIKQFNKENGQGTPLQFLMLNRLKNAGSSRSAKSIGDSIKKHIFQRSVMTRTPKRTPVASECSTPSSVISIPQVRVLFQSPNPKSTITGSHLKIQNHPLHNSISSVSLVNATSSTLGAKQVNSRPKDTNATPVDRKDINQHFESETNPKNLSKKCDWIFPRNAICNSKYSVDMRNFLFKYNSETDILRCINEGCSFEPATPTKSLRKCMSLNDLNTEFKFENLHHLSKHSVINNHNIKFSSNALNEIRSSILRPSDIIACSKYEDIHTPVVVSTYRCKAPITSTPSLAFGRRSMSPITKSTQRMPKYMQESIMTPRSRKPVLLTTNMGLLDNSQSAYQGELFSFREQDEDSFLVQNASAQILGPPYRSFIGDSGEQKRNEIQHKDASTSDSLTNTFRYHNFDIHLKWNQIVRKVPENSTVEFINRPLKQKRKEKLHIILSYYYNLHLYSDIVFLQREYLLGRSVLTTSPVDESFSSQSDDFGSTPDIRDLNESEMSSSLLYCLNGKQPESLSGSLSGSEYRTTSLNIASISSAERLTRKRMASSKLSLHENENDQPNEEKVTKKVLILEKNPNETSL